MELPNVSVIIITHNNPTIYQCIQCIQQQICLKDQIIIVDDHSPEIFYTSLKSFCDKNNIILLSSIKTGNRAYNRNLGANQAINPILIFVDADTLLINTSIAEIKHAYATKDNIAYIGTRAAGRYDSNTMNILKGIDVQKIINNNTQFDFMLDIPIIKDSRITERIYDENLQEQKYYWIYYYSCCCTILQSVFKDIGGFFEGFLGWGVEDIDLGYRISLLGNISFLRNFGGIHIPHERTVLYAEQDNCYNLKTMLKRFQRFDVEFVSVYRISAIQLKKVKNFLNQMQSFNLSILKTKQKKDTLYINSVSSNTPNGKITHFDSKGNKRDYNLIGISTFFENKSISTVYVSSNILLYPISIICGIFQESIRIGKQVILDGILPNFRIDWNDFPNLANLQPQKRNEYRVYDLMEFSFEKVPDKFQFLVKSDYLALEESKNVPSKVIIDLKKKHQVFSNAYCVINLTYGTGYKLLLNQLQKKYDLRYLGIYSVSNCLTCYTSIVEFPEHLYSLFSLNCPLMIIVEKIDNFSFNTRRWNERNHDKDIIIDCYGNYI